MANEPTTRETLLEATLKMLTRCEHLADTRDTYMRYRCPKCGSIYAAQEFCACTLDAQTLIEVLGLPEKAPMQPVPVPYEGPARYSPVYTPGRFGKIDRQEHIDG